MSEKKFSFWDMFRFTKDGKPKSSVIVNTFSLSILFLVIYAVAYFYLIDVIHNWLIESPVWVTATAESIIPGIVGTIICMLFALLIKNKRLIFLAYCWLAFFAVIVLVMMVIMLWKETDAFILFLNFFALFVPVPLLFGGGISFLWMKDYQKKNLPIEEKPAWE